MFQIKCYYLARAKGSESLCEFFVEVFGDHTKFKSTDYVYLFITRPGRPLKHYFQFKHAFVTTHVAMLNIIVFVVHSISEARFYPKQSSVHNQYFKEYNCPWHQSVFFFPRARRDRISYCRFSLDGLLCTTD